MVHPINIIVLIMCIQRIQFRRKHSFPFECVFRDVICKYAILSENDIERELVAMRNCILNQCLTNFRLPFDTPYFL